MLAPESIYAHLVEALAELANGVWDDRDALKHLACDRIDNVEQLDEHLLVKSLLTFRLGVSSHA